MKTYPNTFKLLEIMSHDNDLSMKQTGLPYVGAAIEEMASTLEGEEFELMAAGEQTEMETLVQRKNLRMLDTFLQSAFDGPLAAELWSHE